MMLETGDLLAIMIALAGASVVMIFSIMQVGRLTQENDRLRQKLVENNYQGVKNG